MSKSPGHQKWPHHKIAKKHLSQKIRFEINGEILAESHDVIRLDEDEHPTRYYFPRSDVQMTMLQRNHSTTYCPFKGMAHHFDVHAGETKFPDAAWTHEDPYEEHLDLKGRFAFYEEKIPNGQIDVEPEAA